MLGRGCWRVVCWHSPDSLSKICLGNNLRSFIQGSNNNKITKNPSAITIVTNVETTFIFVELAEELWHSSVFIFVWIGTKTCTLHPAPTYSGAALRVQWQWDTIQKLHERIQNTHQGQKSDCVSFLDCPFYLSQQQIFQLSHLIIS